jgi:predicted PurR-regulated permease PerM
LPFCRALLAAYYFTHHTPNEGGGAAHAVRRWGIRMAAPTMPGITPDMIRPKPARPGPYAVSGQVMMTVIFAVVIVAALYIGRDILMPFALAVLLSFILAPLVRKLQQWYVPRGLAVTSVVLLAFAVIFVLGAVIVSQVNQLASDLPRYQWTLKEKIQSLRGAAGAGGTLERASEVLQDLGKELNRPQTQPQAGQMTTPATTDRAAREPLLVEVRQPETGAMGTLLSVIRPLIHPLAMMGLVIIFVIFILWQRQDLRNRLVRLAGSNDLHRTTKALNDAGQRLSRLFLTQLLLNAAFGLIVGVGWWMIGVPSAPLWGILVMVLRFMPYIGTWISAIFPLLLAAAVGTDWTMVIWAGALFLVVDIIIGQFVEPLVQGHSTGLSPVAVIASATFWTWLWGPIGLVLATPITMTLAVLGRHIESLKFLDVLFGDRPPLTPPELAYQRMLARDPVEVTEEAWTYLKTKPLLDYYQEILLGGVRLAQIDTARGMLDEEGRESIRDSVVEIVDDLQDHVDQPASGATGESKEGETPLAHLSKSENAALEAAATLPESWTRDGSVLCIPGNGPLDHALALIVASLVERRGPAARAEKADALSMSRIFSLDTENTQLICVCYVEDVTPAQLRYALRRLRRKAPNARFVISLLGETDNVREAEVLADYANVRFARQSLQETVEAIVTIAREDVAPAERDKDALPASA